MNQDPKREAHGRLLSRLLDGPGHASQQARRLAFDNAWTTEPLHTVLGKLVSEPARVTEADIRQVGAAGVTEDVIFELVVCAAVGTADRQYRAGLAALAEVLGDGGGAADEA